MLQCYRATMLIFFVTSDAARAYAPYLSSLGNSDLSKNPLARAW